MKDFSRETYRKSEPKGEPRIFYQEHIKKIGRKKKEDHNKNEVLSEMIMSIIKTY